MCLAIADLRRQNLKDWYFIAEQPAPAPHLAHPEECAAPQSVLVAVPRVSRSREHFPDGFDLHHLRSLPTPLCPGFFPPLIWKIFDSIPEAKLDLPGLPLIDGASARDPQGPKGLLLRQIKLVLRGVFGAIHLGIGALFSERLLRGRALLLLLARTRVTSDWIDSSTGVSRPSVTPPPLDPTVGPCLGPYGGPMGLGILL